MFSLLHCWVVLWPRLLKLILQFENLRDKIFYHLIPFITAIRTVFRLQCWLVLSSGTMRDVRLRTPLALV